MKRLLALTLAMTFLLWGCSEDPASDSTPDSTGTAATVDFAQTDTDLFTQRDLDATWENATQIDLDSAGDTVTIRNAGTYLLSGTLEGSVTVDADSSAKIQLVLDGATIHNDSGAAICILEADKVFLTLAPNSENSLSSGENPEDDTDAALYSRCDLTLNGEGGLTVTAPGGHGISAKDDLAITGGIYTVSAAGHAMDANDSIRICGGSFDMEAGKDGLHAQHSEDTALGYVYISGGSFVIQAEGDGISAGAYLQIENGSFDILAGGGWENGDKQQSGGYGDFPGGMSGGMGGGMGGRPRSGIADTEASDATDESTSMKGLKAATGMLITSGSFTVDSADDALHSDTTLTINGGSFALSSGDDAVHAEERLTVTACTMEIATCYEGLEALEIYISGGSIRLTSTDDGLNAAGGTDSSGTGGRDNMFGGGMGQPGGMSSNSKGIIEISGGTLYINASGDGIDANGSVLISGGDITVVGPTAGDTATLDYDTSCVITGGTFIGTGAGGMAQTFSDNTQGVFACSVNNQSAGTRITLTDSDGNILFDYTPELSYAVVILSSPALRSGEEYTITVGTVSGTLEAQ